MTRLTILSLLVTTAAACGGDDDPPIDPPADAPPVGATCPTGTQDGTSCRLPERILASVTLTNKFTYVIPAMQPVYVMPGATLTIEPGTELRGQQGGRLVITRGARILAEGTAAAPIVMTSAQPIGSRTPGWWGGLSILGSAPVNVNQPTSNEATYEAIPPTDAEGKFGGTNANDDSGVLKYVRIEFTGFEYMKDREFNGLTLCGVGDGTVIDFVQVHRGSDDGIEFFGGTVNVKHLVSSQNEDDGFDTDNGWQGKAQFVIIQNVTHPAALADASNGYESDNHGTSASYAQAPRTLPTVSHVTLIGDHDWTGGANWAAIFRRGTGGRYANHIWLNFQKGPEIRDAATAQQVTDGNLTVANSMLFGNDAPANNNLPPPQATNDIDETLVFKTDAATGNTRGVDPGLPAAVTNKTQPSFLPTAGAAALTGGVPPADPFFDQTATFRGAMGTVDWTAGWTVYPQG